MHFLKNLQKLSSQIFKKRQNLKFNNFSTNSSKNRFPNSNKTFFYSTSNGINLSSQDSEAISQFNDALDKYLSLNGDAFANLDKASRMDPEFGMAWIFLGFLKVASTGVRFLNYSYEPVEKIEAKVGNLSRLPEKELAQAISNASKCFLDKREKFHLEALKCWATGGLKEAAYFYELALIENPRDLLASRCAHDTYFFLGDCVSMRNSICRVLPSHGTTEEGRYRLYGMHAFALEECNEYRLAEDSARKCIDYDPSDIQGCHALAHCYEMQARYREGIEFLNATEESWKKRDQLDIHNYWHQALFLINLDMHDKALEMYDLEIRIDKSRLKLLDLVDATSLLQRLSMLCDVDVGNRQVELAESCQQYLDTQTTTFNDIHQMMALCGIKDFSAQEAHLKRIQNICELGDKVKLELPDKNKVYRRSDDYVQHSKLYGLKSCQGLKAFAEQKYSKCIEYLLPVVLFNPSPIGGSHAQRNIICDTLKEAAKRSSNDNLFLALKYQKSFKHWTYV